MNDHLLQLYHRLPPAARNVCASARGVYLRRWRYGPDTDLSALTKLPERRRAEFASKLWGSRNGSEPEIKPAPREEQQVGGE